jgi:hypothetical protein
MVTIKIKGGTPQGSGTLCQTCSYGHLIKGFRATEEEVFCRYFYLEREIRFPVSECTFYEDRRLASKKEMEDIAWILRTDMPRRRVGFISPEQLREIEAGAAVLPAAFLRLAEGVRLLNEGCRQTSRVVTPSLKT